MTRSAIAPRRAAGCTGTCLSPRYCTANANGNLTVENYVGNIADSRKPKVESRKGTRAQISVSTSYWSTQSRRASRWCFRGGVRTTLPGVTGGLLSAKVGGDHRFYIPDMQGHVRQVTDVDGDAIAEYQYDAWGLIQLTAASAMAFGDRGYTWDGKPGRYYVQQRHLRADLGRWMSVDPVETEPPYAYVANRPTWAVDPTGLRPLSAHDKHVIARLLAQFPGPVASVRDPGRMLWPRTPESLGLQRAVALAAQALRKEIEAVPVDKGAERAYNDVLSRWQRHGATGVELELAYRRLPPDPPGLRAAMWAIEQLGDARWGKAGAAPSTIGSGARPDEWKCNLFVANAYARGADLGWGGVGVPVRRSLRQPGVLNPTSANDLGNPAVTVRGFPVVAGLPRVGDIVAFHHPTRGGHAAIYLGGGYFRGLVIYASEHAVKVETIQYVLDNVGEPPYDAVTFRRYHPGG
ncbi:MAG: hypothetical protein FJX72_00175 [Armatimonadetes bacterium]|nr:hypothetical protein [Armatimonadota bacterium]